jgi:hypothetical protein
VPEPPGTQSSSDRSLGHDTSAFSFSSIKQNLPSVITLDLMMSAWFYESKIGKMEKGEALKRGDKR